MVNKRLEISTLRGYTTFGQKAEKVAQLMVTGTKLAIEELRLGHSERAETILSHLLKEIEDEANFKTN